MAQDTNGSQAVMPIVPKEAILGQTTTYSPESKLRVPHNQKSTLASGSESRGTTLHEGIGSHNLNDLFEISPDD